MDYLNAVELRGLIGDVRMFVVGDSNMARFSVATDYAYRNRQGEHVIETTWHSVVAYEGKKTQVLDLKKGSAVHLKGRIRRTAWTTPEGDMRSTVEVVASELAVIDLNNQEGQS